MQQRCTDTKHMWGLVAAQHAPCALAAGLGRAEPYCAVPLRGARRSPVFLVLPAKAILFGGNRQQRLYLQRHRGLAAVAPWQQQQEEVIIRHFILC
jgi:hypothetical protein